MKNYNLGVRDGTKFFDMNTIPTVPVYLYEDYDKKFILAEELRKSPLVWVKYQNRGDISGNLSESLYMLTNNYKMYIILREFSPGNYFLSVRGIFPKKQSDTRSVLRNYIQVRHRFILLMKGTKSYADPAAAWIFFNRIKNECIRLNIAEELEKEDDLLKELLGKENTDLKESIAEFCNIHTRLIDFEEEYDKKKGYDFTYSAVRATEKNENIKGVSYCFKINESLERLDKDALVGQSILIKKDEEDKGIPATINDIDSQNNEFIIKILKIVGHDEIPQSGYIKKSDRNVTFEIQRAAFNSIAEGSAVNQRIFNNIALGECFPITNRTVVKMDKLTESQEKAINMAINAEDFMLVQGPPGTGKTEIIVAMLKLFVDQGKKVLVSSKNNLAVDNVLEKCIDKGLKCIRLGRPETVKIDKVRSVLVDVYVLALQKEIEQHARKYQENMKENVHKYNEKLGILESVWYRLEEKSRVQRKLIWTKILLFLFKLLKLISFVPYFARKHDILNQNVNKITNILQGIIEEIRAKSAVVGLEFTMKNKAFKSHVDILIKKYKKMIEDAPKKLSISEQWIKELQGRQDVLSEISLEHVQIIGATCIGVNTNRLFKDMEYDVAIIDEAGQIQLHDIIVPMSKAKKTILIGDHKQLPPVADDDFIKEAREKFEDIELNLDEIYKVSLFEKLFHMVGDENKIMLDTQFRMHEDIAEPISELFYEGKYKTGCKKEHRLINFGGLKNPIYFVDTCDMPEKYETVNIVDNQNVYTNHTEAAIIAKVIGERIDFLNEGIRILDYKGERVCTLEDVGIITPYKAQIECIKKHLFDELINSAQIDRAKVKNIIEKIEIDTVDSFQGRDKEIIFYSFVRSNPECKIGFLNELRRLNVTITRAKRLLIMVGDSHTLINTTAKNPLSGDKPPRYYFKAFIEYCKQKGYYHKGFISGGAL
ncbi:MAG: AAA family ATPase [Clostridiaceae bacterium]|nr:AAA family ATPase [Clostridiaceae bacterium]